MTYIIKADTRCDARPGLPMMVENSADMVWVRSPTLLKLRVSAGGAGTAAAANPVAAAPVKKLRRLKAARTFASHPATHISSPVLLILSLHAILVVQSNIGNRRADAGRPVARMERSVIRDRPFPDYASLHPGYRRGEGKGGGGEAVGRPPHAPLKPLSGGF